MHAMMGLWRHGAVTLAAAVHERDSCADARVEHWLRRCMSGTPPAVMHRWVPAAVTHPWDAGCGDTVDVANSIY